MMKSILLLCFVISVASAQFLATYNYPNGDSTCSDLPFSLDVSAVGGCYPINENPIWYRSYCDANKQQWVSQTCSDSNCNDCTSQTNDANVCNISNNVNWDAYTSFNCSADPSEFIQIPGTLTHVFYSERGCKPTSPISSVSVSFLNVCSSLGSTSYYYSCPDVNHAYQYYCQSSNCTDCKKVPQNLVGGNSCYEPEGGSTSVHNFCNL